MPVVHPEPTTELALLRQRLDMETTAWNARFAQLDAVLCQQAEEIKGLRSDVKALTAAITSEKVDVREKAIGYLFGALLMVAGALVAYLLKR